MGVLFGAPLDIPENRLTTRNQAEFEFRKAAKRGHTLI